MLKASSLPPSMAKRERTKPKYGFCPRSYRDLQTSDGKHMLREIKGPNKSAIESEFEELRTDFIDGGRRSSKTTTPKRERKVSIRIQAGTHTF